MVNSLIFWNKSLCLVLLAMGCVQVLTATPRAWADRPAPPITSPAGHPKPGIESIERKLESLTEDLFARRRDLLLAHLLNRPSSAANHVVIYFTAQGMADPPRRMALDWNGQAVSSAGYSGDRHRAITQGGTEQWLVLQASPGLHSLRVSQDPFGSAPDPDWTPVSFRVDKTEGPLILILRASMGDHEPEWTMERLQWPMKGWEDRLIDIAYENALFHYDSHAEADAAGILLNFLDHPAVEGKRPGLLLLLAKAYWNMGLISPALRAARETAEHTAASPAQVREAWYYIQKANYRRGNYPAVASAYERIGNSFRQNVQSEMHYLAGQSQLRQKRYAQAIASFGRIPRNSPYHPYALYGTAMAYLGFGDAYAAQQTFKKLATFDPIIRGPERTPASDLSEKSRVTLGFLFIEQGRHGEAIELLGGLPVDSRFLDQALFGIGWSYMNTEEFTKAIVVFKDLAERYPDSAYTQEAQVLMAYSYSKLKAYPRAVGSYRDALENTSRAIGNLTEKIRSLERSADSALTRQPRSPGNRLWEVPPVVREISRGYQRLSAFIEADDALRADKKVISRLEEVRTSISSIASRNALESLINERDRLEGLSIKAGIGIAKSLILEQTEFGREELILE